MSIPHLDPTDLNILVYLAKGLTSKEIAPKVFLSEARVIQRIVEMMQEVHVKNRTELVFYYSEKIRQLDQNKAA
jgi:DNA-binding NarL/FixJ family response regulator